MKASKKVFGYTVLVHWEGRTWTHLAWTREEALEWMACYPRGCTVQLYRGAKLVASREEVAGSCGRAEQVRNAADNERAILCAINRSRAESLRYAYAEERITDNARTIRAMHACTLADGWTDAGLLRHCNNRFAIVAARQTANREDMSADPHAVWYDRYQWARRISRLKPADREFLSRMGD